MIPDKPMIASHTSLGYLVLKSVRSSTRDVYQTQHTLLSEILTINAVVSESFWYKMQAVKSDGGKDGDETKQSDHMLMKYLGLKGVLQCHLHVLATLYIRDVLKHSHFCTNCHIIKKMILRTHLSCDIDSQFRIGRRHGETTIITI